ncbi:PASTA domain-containing protein [Granulicoccus sp. GXG6511]|uniref:PASTA domain-containing protein n=1 Tax=Granulicoccus sp. GXG6511 TaxID=3381351 RepID=UPI003D7D87BB
MSTPAAPKPPRKRKITPFLLVSLGSMILGLIAGLVLGGVLPSLRPQPAPIVVTLEPETQQATTQERVMPDIRGLSEKDAQQTLADYGVNAEDVSLTRIPHLSPAGFVVAQDPIGGTKNPGKVTLSLPEPAQVPDLAGRGEETARTALLEMGATATVTRRYAPGAQPGQVVESSPKAGEPLVETVALVVAATPQTAYLGNIRASGSCSRGSVSVNGVRHENSATCSASRGRQTETYWLLNRRTATLTGTLGLDDRSDPDARVRIVIAGDGRELFAGEFRYGESRSIDVPTLNVLRFTVTTERLDEGRNNATMVLGEAVVSGSVDDLASLEQR